MNLYAVDKRKVIFQVELHSANASPHYKQTSVVEFQNGYHLKTLNIKHRPVKWWLNEAKLLIVGAGPKEIMSVTPNTLQLG